MVCALTGERTHGRRVGTCWVGSQDLAEAVIAAGLARDCSCFSGGRYAGVEQPQAQALPLPGYCWPRQRGSAAFLVLGRVVKCEDRREAFACAPSAVAA